MPTSADTIPAKIISSHALTKKSGPAVTSLKKSLTACTSPGCPMTDSGPAIRPDIRITCARRPGQRRRSPHDRAARPWLSASADHEHGPVGQVDHLVRRAAQDQPGQVTPAPRAHDDGADVLGLGLGDDLAGRVAVDRVPHDA